MAGLTEPYTIRPARNEDGPAITALIYEILHEYGLPPDPEETDQGLDRVEDYFDLFEVIEAPGEGIIATLGLVNRGPSWRGPSRLASLASQDEEGSHSAGQQREPTSPTGRRQSFAAPLEGPAHQRGSAPRSKTCELVKMFVHPRQRGKGLGQFLLDRAIEQAKLMGFTVMELETASVLKEAIGLYRKAGFVETESGPHAKRCDITMVRTL